MVARRSGWKLVENSLSRSRLHDRRAFARKVGARAASEAEHQIALASFSRPGMLERIAKILKIAATSTSQISLNSSIQISFLAIQLDRVFDVRSCDGRFAAYLENFRQVEEGVGRRVKELSLTG